uniref:Uncharacterized protein n=1 Tax=Siphoviridae sp. ctsYb1 TaxID=2825696 RepID=A0A8S5VI98_9CAUD|nr:MAG TPA: hypothetical protein [Siphoviridae sp. ctsYb1]
MIISTTNSPLGIKLYQLQSKDKVSRLCYVLL